MIADVGFEPQWASAPGETIAEILAQRDLSLSDFASEIGERPGFAQDLLEGRAAITLSIARTLARVFGASVEFWMSREFQFREDASRLRAAESQWVASLPLSDMVKFGWLAAKTRSTEQVAACLEFFGMASVAAWQSRYASLLQNAAFRKSSTFESDPAAVATWLRRGELEGEAVACAPWDPEEFRKALQEIRTLTRLKDPERFLPKLKQLCAENGVAIAVVRTPTGCRASGATRWLSDKKALLLFSFRYLTDDQFWFTLFHEAAHLLLHKDTDLFLEGVENPESHKEDDANDFASKILVPPEYAQELHVLRANSLDVIRFASRVGVAPGIIVGQMQHRGIVGYHQLNFLKRRFVWTVSDASHETRQND